MLRGIDRQSKSRDQICDAVVLGDARDGMDFETAKRRPRGTTLICTSGRIPKTLVGNAGRAGRRAYSFSIASKVPFVAERVLSFQLTVLKVLAGLPDGSLSVAELTRYVSVLMSSGPDWSDRMRRLAIRASNLDIFSDKLVLRDDSGWQITDSGRQFLSVLEAAVLEKPRVDQSTGLDSGIAAPKPVQPALRLVVDNTQNARSDPAPDETRRSA